VHHGDVGISGTEFWNHYGDLHGNSYGFHYGPVGDGVTQNQINATNVYATGVFSNIGTPGQNWTLYGTVVAPSERGMKTAVEDFDGGAIVDAVPCASWRWKPEVNRLDGQRHAGPMADDIADHAPWLVRAPDDSTDPRMLSDRDLIGVLWNALRDARARITELEARQ
jgi:hypothetical protein